MTCTYFPYSQANGLQRLHLVAMVHVHGLGASFKLAAIAICGQEAMTGCAVESPSYLLAILLHMEILQNSHDPSADGDDVWVE